MVCPLRCNVREDKRRQRRHDACRHVEQRRLDGSEPQIIDNNSAEGDEPCSLKWQGNV